MPLSRAERAEVQMDAALHAFPVLPENMPPNTRLSAKSLFEMQPSLTNDEFLQEFMPKAYPPSIGPLGVGSSSYPNLRQEQNDECIDASCDGGLFDDSKIDAMQNNLRAAHASQFPGPVERDLASLGYGLSGCKTAMVKNIPVSYRQHEMLQTMRKVGYEGLFDFLYLPAHIRDGNRGFAFVNFTDMETAEEFYHRYNGNFKLFGVGRAQQPLAVMPAVVQGLKANIENLVHHKRWHTWQEPPFILDASIASIKGFMGIASAVASTPTKRMQHMLPKTAHPPSRQKKVQVQQSRTKIFCESCGHTRASDYLFCAFCGERFS